MFNALKDISKNIGNCNKHPGISRKDAVAVVDGYAVGMGVVIGTPEYDDRYAIWRTPLKSPNGCVVGEAVVDALSSRIDESRTTARDIIEHRLQTYTNKKYTQNGNSDAPIVSTLSSTAILGDSEEILATLPENSIDLVFTSPPYYNARPEYAEYADYDGYLEKMRRVIRGCHRVMNEGRFFVINISPVLIRRSSRSDSSHRIALPFDFHRLFIEEEFEFVDDIIWVKPEGAGWATGRGRRFSADRNPLQYKPVPVTEYILVYRKKTDRLIDWLIRKHPDQQAVADSRIVDGYEVTNVWKINPSYNSDHPAVFPRELAEKVISYYSFRNDVVLDPFAGTGTTAVVAEGLGRRYVAIERDSNYFGILKNNLKIKNNY